MYLFICKLVLLLTYFAGIDAAALHNGKTVEKQSPINIDISRVNVTYLPDLEFLFESTGPLTLESTRYTLKLKAADSKHFISGGPLNGRYQFEELYFHWGTENKQGSEHTILDKAYAMEMQAVHRNVERPDDLAVVGYLFQLSNRNNAGLTNLLNVAVSAAQNPGNQIEVNSFPVDTLVVPFAKRYFIYDGSLTISPYTENVIWIIPDKYYDISQQQLNIFRNAAEQDEQMVNNFRPLQSLNSRQVAVAF